jgi:uncharacterized protein YqjF (DUF2071 family)
MQAPVAPHVRRPIMIHHWRLLTFLHWRYPAELVQSELPSGLTVETFEGVAWVGVIPFLMDDVRPPGLPPLPRLSRFPETNVRTYVRGPDGGSGLWVLSLDAGRLAAVATARATYGLPYCWSTMSVHKTGTHVVYRARRRWPGPAGARCDARVEFGPRLNVDDLSAFDHFLTARYRLYSTLAGRLVTADAEHPRWPLRQARLLELEQSLIPAAGLPAPDHEPVLHASDGVAVRIGMWRPV